MSTDFKDAKELDKSREKWYGWRARTALTRSTLETGRNLGQKKK